ncbi:MAG: hypothetical protein WC756_21555 [Taibaiella sp.]|jgi:hypothetical protein
MSTNASIVASFPNAPNEYSELQKNNDQDVQSLYNLLEDARKRQLENGSGCRPLYMNSVNNSNSNSNSNNNNNNNNIHANTNNQNRTYPQI